MSVNSVNSVNSINLVIGSNSDEQSADSAILYYNDIQEGYVFSMTELTMKIKDYHEFYENIKILFSDIKKFNFSRNKSNILFKLIHDKFKIYVCGDAKTYYVSIYTKTEDDLQILWNIFKKYDVINGELSAYMTSFYIKNNGVSENFKEIKLKDFEYLSDLYYPYIDLSVMFDQFFTGSENILLCVGEPGVGKSKLNSIALKYAMQNPDKLPYDKFQDDSSDDQYISIAMVKSIGVLSSDEFWCDLESKEFDFVIIDDLDYMLTKRDSEMNSGEDIRKNAFLNQFLSFTDGVENHKTKFIITTNQLYDDIDTAVLRKGRLFDIIELRTLTRDEALAIWFENNLSESDFNKEFKTLNVLPADLGSEIDKKLNTRIENASSSYLKEQGISKIKHAGRSKKIGL